LFVNKQAAAAAGILPQVRWQHAPNKKRIGCDLAEDIALAAVCLRPKFIS